MCSRMSWYEPPDVEVAASEDDRVCEDMVWMSMSGARRGPVVRVERIARFT